MPDIFAASPAPSCSLLLFGNGIYEYQPLGTDPIAPRAREARACAREDTGLLRARPWYRAMLG